MKLVKIIGWIILAFAAVFWFSAIGLAIGHGLFENENALQLIVLGGAVSMVAGVLLWYGD
jgi:hypothetical protein